MIINHLQSLHHTDEFLVYKGEEKATVGRAQTFRWHQGKPEEAFIVTQPGWETYNMFNDY